VATGTKLMTLYDETRANNYSRNQATFNGTDDLVLNDGVLWDINSRKVRANSQRLAPLAYVCDLYRYDTSEARKIMLGLVQKPIKL